MSEQISSMTGRVVATIASRAYVTLLGLLVLPIYLQRLGPEAYGLVALYATLQVWLQLLDLGLVATLAREVARTEARAAPGADLRRLLRALEVIFVVVLLLATVLLIVGSEAIAQRWLQLRDMQPAQVSRSIQWMAVAVTARLMGELYRGAISGFERLGWLALSNAAFGTLRLLGVLPFVAEGDHAAQNFFAFQFGVGMLELLVLKFKSSQLMRRWPQAVGSWNARALRSQIGFSMTMSMAMFFWLLASQFDKLVLSGLLSLADYGAFGVTVAAAAGVLLATGALADVLMPRITSLQAQDRVDEVRQLYRRSSQWTAVIACAVSAVMACHAENLLRTWTGNPVLATSMAPVLALYALGNAAMAIGALPYYLQLAQGSLKLHLIGTGLMLVLLLPSMVIATRLHGALGAAQAWFVVNSLYLITWTAVAHRRFMPGVHRRWVSQDIAPAMMAATVAGLASRTLPWPEGRIAAASVIIAVSCAVMLAAVLAAPSARGDLLRLLRRRHA